jgi:cytochrome c553
MLSVSCNKMSLQGDCANLKILLLYICVFPNKHHIRRSRLIRRWLAEGYVEVPMTITQQVIADQNLEKLIDLNIIRPVDPSKNAKPKTCRAHGIMHEFLLHIARSVNFITDLGNPLRNNYRHLFLEGRPSTGRTSNFSVSSSDEKEEPRAHSLTVCGSCHTRFSKEQNQANHMCAQEVHTYARIKKYQKQCYYITYT